MKLNRKVDYSHVVTHGGQQAFPHLTPEQKLRRLVMSCLLWEDQFYVDGKTITENIFEAADNVSPLVLATIADEARNKYHLRHVPLLLTALLAKRGGSLVSETINNVIQRADELSEFLAIYWRNGKTPLSNQIKKGLAKAFTKFNAYSLAKYNRDNTIKLRDVLFLVHAKPKDQIQADVWKQLVNGTLPSPDTWEVALSSGKNKKETFERLLKENSLGYLALLRNLRGMTEADVDEPLIKEALLARKGADKVLPFRYIAAARACPRLEPAIDQALLASLENLPTLSGRTVVLVDVSGSMDCPLSQKSDLTRLDAAAALASVVKSDNLRVFTFSNFLAEVPPRRGMAGVDVVRKSQPDGKLVLTKALHHINLVPHDRLIIITDEQVTDGTVPNPVCDKAYMINVASYQNGVGYGKWNRISGFSENVLRWIHEVEQ